MNSYTYNETQTFTLTHAKYLASKIATDLKRMQRFYEKPYDNDIVAYEDEIIELLKNGYLESITYGFKRDGKYIEPTLKYIAQELAVLYQIDDDPGKIRPGIDIEGASFYSYLTYSSKWHQLSQTEREKFNNNLSIKRTYDQEPEIEGYLSQDLTYSSGGRSLSRSIVKSY